MDLIWTNLRLPVEEDEENLQSLMGHKLKVPAQNITGLRVIRRSLDARKKPNLFFVYTLQFSLELSLKEVRRAMSRVPELKQASVEEPSTMSSPTVRLKQRPIIVGSGPAGYFAALALARKGYKPLVLERGADVEERTRLVQEFWQTGKLNPETNVQFGEGGAGTFSDGKLTTRIHDHRIQNVLESFVRHGAPKEILYLAKPHIGTDILKEVVKGIRQEILNLGGEVRFRAKLTGFISGGGKLKGVIVNGAEEIETESAILAVGHSARDVYGFLRQDGVSLEGKAFAIGVRIEHPQALINLSQYGVEDHPRLGPADYQLTYQDIETGRGAYAFCMCPGGRVVAAASEEGGVVTNGMSEYKRDSGIANSAIVVTVGPDDFPATHPLGGVEFQRYWEQRAFAEAGCDFRAPAQNVSDFLRGAVSDHFRLPTSYQPGVQPCDLHKVLPESVGNVLERALLSFDTKIHGFAGDQAVMTGIETRTSAPVRILRNSEGESLSLKGLYPAGEGAGYAGGIMSSAVDGLRMAEKLMAKYLPAD